MILAIDIGNTNTVLGAWRGTISFSPCASAATATRQQTNTACF